MIFMVFSAFRCVQGLLEQFLGWTPKEDQLFSRSAT